MMTREELYQLIDRSASQMQEELGGQAAFMRLLVDQKGVAHGRTYDFDEEVLSEAVKVFAGVVCDICQG